MPAQTPTFFPDPESFRRRLVKSHHSSSELWVGFYKKYSRKPSITWPESVDEALCFGWIDGVRKNIDPESYKIRFSPRRTNSVWSNVNIKRAQELIAEGRMQPAGLKAFEARKENRSGIYSYENRPEQLPEPYLSILKQNQAAHDFYQARPPYYRRTTAWWVLSAKKEETRMKRLDQLVGYCERGETLPGLTSPKDPK